MVNSISSMSQVYFGNQEVDVPPNIDLAKDFISKSNGRVVKFNHGRQEVSVNEYSNAKGIIHLQTQGSVSYPANSPGVTLSRSLPANEYEIDTNTGTAVKLPKYVRERGGLGFYVGNETPVKDSTHLNEILEKAVAQINN